MPTQVPQTATVPLTDAQIKALPTGDFTLVAAEGAGKLIVPLAIVITIDTTAGAYTNVTSGFSSLVYNGAADASIYFNNSIFTQGTKRTVVLPIAVYDDSGNGTAAHFNTANAANAPLVLSVGNVDGAFTGGHASNTGAVTVVYLVLDV
jgi:hypothetical protein